MKETGGDEHRQVRPASISSLLFVVLGRMRKVRDETCTQQSPGWAQRVVLTSKDFLMLSFFASNTSDVSGSYFSKQTSPPRPPSSVL